jgi:hypothetical protein
MKHQIHNKFKFFVVEFDGKKLPAAVKKEIVKFANEGKVTPKSIGIEFLESESKLVISLGYAEKKHANKFDISIKKIGAFAGVGSIESIEKSMEKVAGKVNGIVCHEFFVANGEMQAIFLTAE